MRLTREQIHAANVRLYNAYTAVIDSMPKPQQSVTDVAAAVNAFRWALSSNQHASPDIRAPIADAAQLLDRQMASFGAQPTLEHTSTLNERWGQWPTKSGMPVGAESNK
jgi:hypothetical protein